MWYETTLKNGPHKLTFWAAARFLWPPLLPTTVRRWHDPMGHFCYYFAVDVFPRTPAKIIWFFKIKYVALFFLGFFLLFSYLTFFIPPLFSPLFQKRHFFHSWFFLPWVKLKDLILETLRRGKKENPASNQRWVILSPFLPRFSMHDEKCAIFTPHFQFRIKNGKTAHYFQCMVKNKNGTRRASKISRQLLGASIIIVYIIVYRVLWIAKYLMRF